MSQTPSLIHYAYDDFNSISKTSDNVDPAMIPAEVQEMLTPLSKVTQQVCGGAGLQTWTLATLDSTSLDTGLFLFLSGQYWDVG